MRRYENRSTIMTSNRPLEDWGKLLSDVPTAGAILDRFLHHAITLTINGRSYRVKDAPLAGAEAKKNARRTPSRRQRKSQRKKNNEFFALAVACLGIPQNRNPVRTLCRRTGLGCFWQSTDGSGARVALPQSPILRTASAVEQKSR